MLFLIVCTGARADVAFSVADLGTLGGTTSTANGVAGPGTNASGMIVGSSTTNDNSEHAFLYVNGQIFDLNTLCDLSQSDFRVLTVAKTISDSCLIIGEGITNNGEKHAFLLTPLPVEGGRWSYVCCQWCWIQEVEGEAEGGGVWWWESNCGCYRWHGPPGRHPPCPPRPPPCWWFPLPCPPPCHRPTPPPNVTPTPTPRYPGNPTPTPTIPPGVRRTPTPPPNYPPGTTLEVQPTPTPHRGHRGKSYSTPPPNYTTQTTGVKGTPVPRHPRLHVTPTPHGGSSGMKGKPTPKPTPPEIR